MDFIKKTICIDGARSRTQGLMPYYEFGKAYGQHPGGECGTMESLGLESASGDNGNWGQFVANPCFLSENGKDYGTMLHNYYSILNVVREGLKLRRVMTKEGEVIFTKIIGSFNWNDESKCFDGGDEPENIYDYASYDGSVFRSESVDGEMIYRTEAEVGEDFVVLVSNYNGFLDMAKYLDGTDYDEDLHTGISTDDAEDTRKWAAYCQVVDFCIGKINIPDWIYNKHIKAPKSMPCADVEPYKEWLEDYMTLSADCCNARLWEDMGGNDMLKYLKASAETTCEERRELLEGLTYSVPCIEVPLLLLQNYTDVGVLTNLDGVEYDAEMPGPVKQDGEDTRPHGKLRASLDEMGLTESEIEYLLSDGFGVTFDQIIMSGTTVEYPTTERYESVMDAVSNGDIKEDEIPEDCKVKPVEVESLLQTMRGGKRFTDDHDTLLPGVFRKFEDSPAGKYYICTKGDNGWDIEEYTGSVENWINADGMTSEELVPSEGGTKKYRSVTTKESALRISEVYSEEPKEEGEEEITEFCYKVKYDNSAEKPMEKPYEIGNAANVYFYKETSEGLVYRGDFIIETAITTDDETEFFEVRYVIGGYFYGDDEGDFVEYIGGGDIYYEKHVFIGNHLISVDIDGVDNVPVYTEYIDFAGDSKEFYSTRYNLYRTGNTANIISMTTGNEWTKRDGDGNGYAYDAYLVKEDYLTNFSLPPTVDVDVTIDRGGASAFERHYNLSECNTMRDLEQYRNGYFFPDDTETTVTSNSVNRKIQKSGNVIKI